MRGWDVFSVRASVGRDRMYLGLRVTPGTGGEIVHVRYSTKPAENQLTLSVSFLPSFFQLSATRVMNREGTSSYRVERVDCRTCRRV